MPVVIEATWQIWIWLENKVANMPSAARAGFGARMIDAVLAAFDLLLRAAYEPRGSIERPRLLRVANHRIAYLRMLLRGARELKHLTIDQHAYVVERLDVVGRMVGGWVRASPDVATPAKARDPVGLTE